MKKEFDNMSLDGRVGFIADKHRYIDMEDEDRYFRSVTSLLKDYKEEFNAKEVAEKVTKDERSQYFGRDVEEVVKEWGDKGKAASSIGTELHKYAEDLLNGVVDVVPPDDERAKYVPEFIKWMKENGYELAKTEMLLYSIVINIAGQSDLLLKKKYGDKYYYMIYDFKFLNKPLVKKSYYNRRERKYKTMKFPFKYLHDTNYYHYSIQLAIYQTLTGDPELIKEKVLVVFTPEGYELVPAYPMRVYWNHNNELHAVYQLRNGKWWISEKNQTVEEKPTFIKGL